MKKRRTLFILLLALSALSLPAKQISQQTARSLAASFMQQHGITISSNAAPKASAPRKAKAAWGDNAAYYVYNGDGGRGFVIVSGDDRTDAIIGYSDTGTFDENDIPGNMKAWLEGYTAQINYLDSAGITDEMVAQARARAPQKVAKHAAIAPLIQTKWSQDSPYWNLCPMYEGRRCLVGCVATALSQIMYYHQWPKAETKGIPAYTTYDLKMKIDSLPPVKFEWDKISQALAESGNAVATLAAYCGHAVEMSYTPDVSGAYSEDVTPALINYFGYDKVTTKHVNRRIYSINSWDSLIYNELDGKRPVLYCGSSYNWGGHAFVCDGYDGSGLYHINWGWRGQCDGYFKLSVLQPYHLEDYTEVNHDGFNYSQKAVIGIQKPTGGETDTDIHHLTLSDIFQNKNVIQVDLSNCTGEDKMFHFGWAVPKPDGDFYILWEELDLLGNKSSMCLTIADTCTNMFPAGTYSVVPVSRDTTTEVWKNAFIDSPYSVEAVVDEEGKVTFTLLCPKLNLTVDSVRIVGVPMAKATQYLHFYVTSHGAECNDNLYLFASKTDTLGKDVNMVGTSIEKDCTEDVVVSFIPADTGMYHLWLSTDEAGQNVIATDSVKITQPAVPSNLEVLSFSVDAAAGTASATIRNNATISYPGQMRLDFIVPDSIQALTANIPYRFYFNTGIQPGETRTFNITFDGSFTPGVLYQMQLRCYKYYSSSQPDIILSTITVGTSTGIGTAASDDASAPYCTIQGIKIQQPKQKGLYIRKGRKVVID